MTPGSSENVLAPMRARIDELDAAIVDLLAARLRTVHDVIALKQAHGIAARLDGRVEAVVAGVRRRAEGAGCPPDLAEQVWRTMIDWIIAYEERQLAAPLSSNQSTANG